MAFGGDVIKIVILIVIILAVIYTLIPGKIKLRVNERISDLTNIPESTITKRMGRIFDLKEAVKERQRLLEESLVSLERAKEEMKAACDAGDDDACIQYQAKYADAAVGALDGHLESMEASDKVIKETAKTGLDIDNRIDANKEVADYERLVTNATNAWRGPMSMKISERVEYLDGIIRSMEAVSPVTHMDVYTRWLEYADSPPSAALMGQNMDAVRQYREALNSILTNYNKIGNDCENIKKNRIPNPLARNGENPNDKYNNLINELNQLTPLIHTNLLEQEKKDADDRIKAVIGLINGNKIEFKDDCVASGCCDGSGNTSSHSNSVGHTGGGCRNQGINDAEENDDNNGKKGPHHTCTQFGNTQEFTCMTKKCGTWTRCPSGRCFQTSRAYLCCRKTDQCYCPSASGYKEMCNKGDATGCNECNGGCCQHEPNSGCFRSDSIVSTQRGDLKIQDLMIGDYIIVGHKYERVIGFWDYNDTDLCCFVELKTQNAHLSLSPHHLVKAVDGYVQAKHLTDASALYVDGRWEPILSIDTSKSIGFFSPCTFSGRISVDGVLCSAYAKPTDFADVRLSDTYVHFVIHVITFVVRLWWYIRSFAIDPRKLHVKTGNEATSKIKKLCLAIYGLGSLHKVNVT